MSTILSKLYERERPLIYFYLWNESDRLGCEKFTQQTIEHNLFITQPKERTGSVWYSLQELEELEKEAEAKVNGDGALVAAMVAHAQKEWQVLLPYMKGAARINDGTDYLRLFHSMTSFWYTLNTVYFRLPERPTIDLNFKAAIYGLREETQEYSDSMAVYFEEEFKRVFSSFSQYALCVSPTDIEEMIAGRGEALLSVLDDRFENGCFLLDGMLFPFSALETELQRQGLALESVEIGALSEVKGGIGYKGIAKGVVRIIRTKADLALVLKFLSQGSQNPLSCPRCRK
jgi:hypothetical protein